MPFVVAIVQLKLQNRSYHCVSNPEYWYTDGSYRNRENGEVGTKKNSKWRSRDLERKMNEGSECRLQKTGNFSPSFRLPSSTT